MLMVYLRRNIRLLNVLFLPVFLFIGNQTLQNKHSHIYSNKTVIHSHPLEKSNKVPIRDHNHTKAEFFFYNLVYFYCYSHSKEQSFEIVTTSTPNLYLITEEQIPRIIWLYNTDSRDPPALNG